VQLYALFSLVWGSSVELYATLEEARAALEEVRADDAFLAETLTVEPLTIELSLN
jgi:hypothetical protein